MPSRSCAFCAAASRSITARGSATGRAYVATQAATTVAPSVDCPSVRNDPVGEYLEPHREGHAQYVPNWSVRLGAAIAQEIRKWRSPGVIRSKPRRHCVRQRQRPSTHHICRSHPVRVRTVPIPVDRLGEHHPRAPSDAPSGPIRRRLRKDRADLYAKVLANELSANAAVTATRTGPTSSKPTSTPCSATPCRPVSTRPPPRPSPSSYTVSSRACTSWPPYSNAGAAKQIRAELPKDDQKPPTP